MMITTCRILWIPRNLQLPPTHGGGDGRGAIVWVVFGTGTVRGLGGGFGFGPCGVLVPEVMIATAAAATSTATTTDEMTERRGHRGPPPGAALLNGDSGHGGGHRRGTASGAPSKCLGVSRAL
jgi:hypothetical protein